MPATGAGPAIYGKPKTFEDLPTAVQDRVPRNTVIYVTEEHTAAEKRWWEPGWSYLDPADLKAVARVYYGENIFEAPNEQVSWEFLDKLGSGRAEMLKNYRIHADTEYTAGDWLGEAGPVLHIGWNRLERMAHPARWHLHRDAVWIKLKKGSQEAKWTKITEIQGLEVQRGSYDWIVRPTREAEYEDLTDYEKYLWGEQSTKKSMEKFDGIDEGGVGWERR